MNYASLYNMRSCFTVKRAGDPRDRRAQLTLGPTPTPASTADVETGGRRAEPVDGEIQADREGG